MKTAYGIVEKLTDPKMRKDCEEISKLLATDAGMKICRELFRMLGALVACGKDLAYQLIVSERAMGFGKSVRISGRVLQPWEFLALVADKNVLIDEGAPSDHGINTHRMQWWLIYTAWAKGRLKLENQPGDLYVKIGSAKATSRIVLWDDLFDNSGDAYLELGRKKDTFSHAEYLFSWLKGRGSKKPKNTDNNNNNTDPKAEVYQRLSKAFKELEELSADKICTGTLKTF